MKIIDVFFALICGYSIGWVARDFIKDYGVDIGLLVSLVLHYVVPLFALFCLWIAFLIGRKFLFIFQAAKHLLIGAFATIIDLKLFEFLAWTFSLFLPVPPFIYKGGSFLVATSIKYWGNKHWAFEKHEKTEFTKEVTQFFLVTIVGLVLDVGFFYYFTKIMGPQFAIPAEVWVKLSVLMAALIAAVWNFLSYKFFVFKK